MCSDVHHRVGTPHIKCVQMSSKGGDTAHENVQVKQVGGWWVGGCHDAKSCYFVAPFFKLELARFSVKLSIQDGAECGKILTKHNKV